MATFNYRYALLCLICFNVAFSYPEENAWGGPVTEQYRTSTSSRRPGSFDDVPLRIVVFMGVREGRNAARVSRFVRRKLIDSGHEVELIDPEVIDLPLLRKPLHFYTNRGQAPSILRQFDEQVKSADAYVILTSEYNRHLSPALTNLIDHLPPLSFAFKISGIVAYTTSATGGLMAAAQARNLMTELGAPPIPLILHITKVDSNLDEMGSIKWKEPYFEKQMTKFITQLDWFATALRRHTYNVGTPQWNSSVVSV